MTDVTDLQDVVLTLEYHEEERDAQTLREYVASKRGWRHKMFAGLRSFMFWFLIVGTVAAVVYGFVRSMLDGSFFAALGILMFGTLVFGLQTLIQQGSEAVYDWFEGDMPDERVT